jgi:hypothetical protein
VVNALKYRKKTADHYGLALMLALLIPVAAGAEKLPASLEAAADRRELKVNETFLLTITATGGDIGKPKLPALSSVRFDPEPVTDQSSWDFRMTASGVMRGWKHEWQYSGTVLREGVHVIPAVEVMIDGRKHFSGPITLYVNRAAPMTQSRRIGNRERLAATSGNREPDLGDVLLIESEVDKRRVYQGEDVTLTLRIIELNMPGVRAGFSGGRSIPLPDTEGFYTGPVAQEQTLERRNGREYRVNIIRQPLFPAGTGQFRIGAWSWEGNVRFRTAGGVESGTLQLEAAPIEIEVQPLPPRPPEFNGAVGRFRISAKLLKGAAVQGEPVPLQLIVKGRGNPDAIRAPDLPEMDWAMRGAPEMELIHEDESDWARIEKIFTWKITPLETGDQVIPAITFCYFAPMLGNYKTERTPPMRLYVEASPENGELIVTGGSGALENRRIEILADDLTPILREASWLAPARSRRITYALVFAMPPLAFAGFMFFMRRRRMLTGDTRYARRYFALSRARKRLKAAPASDTPGDRLYHALTAWLGDLCDNNPAGLTSAEARELLREKDLPPALMEQYLRLLRTCERKQYSGAGLNPREARALADAALETVEKLDPLLRRPAPEPEKGDPE